MKHWIVFILAITVGAGAVLAQQGSDDRRALAERVEQRYVVSPLSNGVMLRSRDSKAGETDVRRIDVTGGTIAVDGDPVTGSELRKRLGSDADLIVQLSYLSSEDQRALFGWTRPDDGRGTTPRADRPDPNLPPLERAEPLSRAEPTRDDASRRPRQAGGDRVRIFGDVSVERDEEVTGQAIAVLGSVRVDGEVGDQVVAVLGSVTLGPSAVVRGDVVSIGGRVNRSPGAQIRGGVTEVSLSDSGFPFHTRPWPDGWGSPFMWFGGFGALPRLIGTGFRAVLLLLLTGIALVVAGRTVETSAQRVSDNPVKATLVGLVAEILIPPVLFITTIVLAVSIIGIPLLLLLPFLILLLLLMAIVGFAGAAVAIGRAVQRRFSLGDPGPFASIFVGVLVILSPLLIGRILALAGWPATPFAFLLVATGFAVELLVWSSGFGAVLTNAFTRMQAHRAARAAFTAPPAAPPPVQ